MRYTRIYLPNSEAMQQQLFALGYTWKGKEDIRYLSASYLVIENASTWMMYNSKGAFRGNYMVYRSNTITQEQINTLFNGDIEKKKIKPMSKEDLLRRLYGKKV